MHAGHNLSFKSELKMQMRGMHTFYCQELLLALHTNLWEDPLQKLSKVHSSCSQGLGHDGQQPRQPAYEGKGVWAVQAQDLCRVDIVGWLQSVITGAGQV